MVAFYDCSVSSVQLFKETCQYWEKRSYPWINCHVWWNVSSQLVISFLKCILGVPLQMIKDCLGHLLCSK